MDREQMQSFIRDCRPYMIQQLQKEVVYFLKENSILTDVEFNKIIKFESREDQMVVVLDILPTKQFHHLKCFIQYVSDWYSWIVVHYQDESVMMNAVLDEKIKLLDEGEVPPLPSRHVQRNSEYAKLCKMLHALKRNEYIVVHGMRGCGKSTLVVDVLRNSYSLTLDTFKQKVFWLTVGRESSVDELTVQQELCSKLMFNRGYSMQSLPLDSKSAKNILKEKLMNAEIEDCLLILDDVSSFSIIQALDVGCRILVTTDDTSIMKRTKKQFFEIRVSEGFTQEETLSLFSQCIDSIDSEKLPNQAKLIYSICKGFPLTISLISSQLEEHKEDVLNDSSRWDMYVSKLKEKNIGAAIGPYDIARQEQLTSLYKAIGMSIDSLPPGLKEFYQDFALFMDDVNIKAEVLCTLWELDKKDVEDMMREFERKCLVVRAYNHLRNCYIYCVHDLLLDYLKRQISTPEKEALHLKLIQKYEKKHGEDVNNFPVDDNYILLYLGYHLKEANLLNRFPRVYLNLNYIEKKIMNFGAADLLLDFRKYQKLIAHDAESTKRYEEVLHFIKQVGACKATSNSDIVQFGLCEHKDSIVYKMATAMAKDGKYFEILTDIPSEKTAPSVYYGREEIVAATFASDTNVIVANSSGTIKLINISQNQTLITFRGHEKKVTVLQLTKNLYYFLSASYDCTIRIWYLNDYSNLEKSFLEKPRTPSPQLRQTDWLDPWPKQRVSGESAIAVLDKHNLRVRHAQFSNNGTMIVSTADDLTTILWKLLLERKDLKFVLTVSGSEVIENKELFENCVFSNDDRLVLCAAHKGNIFLYQSNDGIRLGTVDIGYEIESLSVIPGTPNLMALILNKECFNLVDLTPGGLSSGDGVKPKPYYPTVGRKREDNFVCSAVSWDGVYIAIATKYQHILIYQLSTGNKIAKFTESSGKIHNLSWSRQNTSLLSIYGTELMKIWHFSKNGVVNCAAKLHSSIFDAQWIWDLEDDDCSTDRPLVTAALDYSRNNEIHVFYDLKEKHVVPSSSNSEITQCCVCPFDGNIIYACKDGSVYLVTLDSWETRQIMNISCQKLLKLKVFAHGCKMLVLALVETDPGKVSLVGCMKRGENGFSRELTIYKRDSEVISEFSADVKINSVYVIENNHILKIYECFTAKEKFVEVSQITECLEQVKLCDISANFSHVITGNHSFGLIRPILSGAKKTMSVFENSEVKIFKFNYDGTKLAVGFSDGCFNIYETESSSKLHSFPSTDRSNHVKFATGQVSDFVWSADDSRIIVIFNREMILFELAEQITLQSILFVSVDKVVCNPSFTKCVTIDADGQFQVIKFPRD